MKKKKPGLSVAETAPKPEAPTLKIIAIIALFAIVLFLVYYFATLSDNSFVTGTPIDQGEFKDNFALASQVYIVMDVRGITNKNISNNILQCGVDFAGSSGMGGKNVSYFSLGDDGCVASDGIHLFRDCFSQLKNGQTIYIKEGQPGAAYYSNGMIVTLGEAYSLGTCSIKRV